MAIIKGIVLLIIKEIRLGSWKQDCIEVFFIPPYTLEGFDLTTISSNLLGGMRRRYH
jgi:hypothetical protein